MNKRKFLAVSLALIISLIGLVGCNGQGENNIKMGSKNFTESMILAEIYSLALEDNGFNVERNFGISGTLVHDALVNDEIDMYPEYTGTALLNVLKMPKMTDPEEVYQTVKDQYQEKFNITWLDYSDVNDSQGLMMQAGLSDEYGVKTISDLQENAHLFRFASNGQFDQRKDGLPGLEKHYGPFDFKEHDVYDASLKYQVLDNDQADVAICYTTEAQLTQKDKYRTLEDDKNFWPPYNVAPIIDSDILKANPEIADIINPISNKIDTELMIELNAKVDLDGQPYEQVAKDFYESIK